MAEAAVNNLPARADLQGVKKPLFGLTVLENVSQMNMLRQVGLLIGLAAAVAVGFAVVLWSQQPDYRPLYGSLNGMDANQVIEVLTQADIGYSIEPNSGALLVKSEDLARARIKLAGAGVAQNDGNVGFEILDKEQGLGTSQFMEATRYRRGLEGELARTVSSLANVKSARVHLAIPKSSVFVRDERKPSASVLVEMYAGRSLEPSQVMAIVNLIATSVPELDKSQITVVDQKGNLLSDQQELSELSMAGKQFDYSRRMEGVYTQRVHNILLPVLGSGRYKAEVSADLDFSAVESTSETFNPDQPALRSEQRVNEQRSTSTGPQGVPGALSNQPPATASAPEVAGGAAAAGAVAPGQPLLDVNGEQVLDAAGKPMLAPYPADTREQSTRNFELDRSISYTKQQQGRLRRLSVAVVVDDQVRVDPASGETTRTPWSSEDLNRFTRLVQDAVGFDASRGDSVSVINTPFVPATSEPMVAESFWEQPWVWSLLGGLKQFLLPLLIIALMWFVLRPALNNITGGGKAVRRDTADNPQLGDMGMDSELAADRISLSGPQSIMLPSPSEGYDAQLNAIKGLVADDPGRVAQVVKEWINADE